MDYRDLPYDAEIEYLKSTGTQWVDLGYTPNTNTIVQLGFQTHADSQEVILGYLNSSDTEDWRLFTTRTQQCVHDLPANKGFGARVRGGNYTLTINEYHNWEIGNHYIKNLATEENILSGSRTTYTGKDTLKLNRVQKINTCTKNSFYYIKIYEATTLVHDLIPVRVGDIGYVYDKVSGQLFGNSGTGSFILGPDVAPGRYANEVAFLESWDNQYIDTGIKPSTDTKIELKCLYCKSGAGLTNYGALIGADDRDNAYILNHSAVANFTYGIEFSNNFANPQTRLLTFDSTASPQNMRVYDEGGSLVTTLTCLRGVFEVNQNLYLFATNRNSTPVYGSNRILYCKIYDGNTLVRDYVPVEYNGIGYMYDKVSGLFFDNQGTGKFLFGSIAKACARSYTRRQLMAKAPLPLEKQYLTFKALESGTFTLSRNAVSYSLDGGVTWTSLAAGTASPSVPAGKTIMWKGTITTGTLAGVGIFSATGSFNVFGNAMSLLFGDNFASVKTLSGKTDAFYSLFLNNNKLVSAKNLSLPAATLVSSCYRQMFQGCSNLVYPPQLPTTTLASECYESMFRDCTSLVNAPQLPATTLKSNCYRQMFQGCTKLTTASVLPATTLTTGCYNNMFRDCTSLTTAPELPATVMKDNCYYGMFNGCTSLTTAPELPAATLAKTCYSHMFDGCTALTSAPVLPATTLGYGCYDNMFYNCISLTTPPELPATTLKSYCYKQMFQGCTKLTIAPELPAVTLVDNCYGQMFRGCTKLSYIKAMFTTTPSTSYTSNWVSGVASSGTFVKNSAATWDVTGVSGIPSGWTVQTADE